MDRNTSNVEDAPIVKTLVYTNNNIPFIDDFKIGRFNLNTGNGILFKNSSNNGAIFKKDNYSLYLFQEDIDATNLPKARGSIIANGINSFGFKYSPLDWIELFYFNIDDIDMNSNGQKDNIASPIVFSMKKKLAGFHTQLDIGIYNYDYTLPSIGMLDTTYSAFDLTLKKQIQSVVGTARFTQREKGFAPIIDSNDFYYGTNIKDQMYPDLGFNGNVSDIFLKLEKNDIALIIENMSQETGGAKADVISLVYNKRIMSRYSLESSISNLSLKDPAGILGSVYPDVRSSFSNGLTNNIDSTLLRLSIGCDF
ncbi:MAG: hypothetical protein C0601_02680 [Candidatus Muiribacterium halophilum]|uniref:Uncharacterized protein n=1 Tax=Muiribacterium halophilum TaxID=2053465 RepID=A0A2N5ZK67_MUIH1|nr:MAG: hypothetical protein C0601_02680 [Candidatus Muirbacterium halophilum]